MAFDEDFPIDDFDTAKEIAEMIDQEPAKPKRKRGRPKKAKLGDTTGRKTVEPPVEAPVAEPPPASPSPELDELRSAITRLTEENREIKEQFGLLLQAVNRLAPDTPDEEAEASGPMVFDNAEMMAAPEGPPEAPADVTQNASLPAPVEQQPAPAAAPRQGMASLTDLIALAKTLKEMFAEPPQQVNPIMALQTQLQPILELFQMFSQVQTAIRAQALQDAQQSSQFMARVVKSIGKDFIKKGDGGGKEKTQVHDLPPTGVGEFNPGS